MASENCTCSAANLLCCPPTPRYVVQTPVMNFKDADIPFWVWLVVAGGALLILVILILLIILFCLCRAQRNHFWCCCFSNDDAKTTFVDKEASPEDYAYAQRGDVGGKRPQIQYRYPEDDAANFGYASGPPTNGGYVPTAQRLTSDRTRVAGDGYARSSLGGRRSSGPVITEYIDVDDQVHRGANNQPTVVAIGKPSSAISAAGPRAPSVVGHHSASVQIGSGGAAAAPTSIWPSL